MSDLKLSPCACGQVPVVLAIEGSQYLRAECACGAVGPESQFFKGCGLDDTDDDQRAVMYWNREREKAAGVEALLVNERRWADRELTRTRLTMLAIGLRALPAERWHYGEWVHKRDAVTACGTVCCAAGWLPVFDPENWLWGRGMFHENLMPVLRAHAVQERSNLGWATGHVLEGLRAYLPAMNRDEIRLLFIDAIELLDGVGCPTEVTPVHVARLAEFWAEHGRMPGYKSLPELGDASR